jgi:GNAT superfamily N-acetyltransferase
MKIIKGFDETRYKQIAQKCDNKQLKKDVSYMRTVIHNKSKIYAETLDDCAFFIGYHNRDHFKLVGIGVDTEHRGKGYGVFMLHRAMDYARTQGYSLIKTRTQSGVDFYQKWGGGRITGMKEADYMMEFDL